MLVQCSNPFCSFDQDLLNRLIACDLTLKDIKGLGKAADDFMILESGEPDDIMREIENRNVFINHVQQMAREKRSRIYGLMVYTFKRRIEELDNLLSSIEEGLKEETESSQDIPSVLAKIKNNEVGILSYALFQGIGSSKVNKGLSKQRL